MQERESWKGVQDDLATGSVLKDKSLVDGIQSYDLENQERT